MKINTKKSELRINTKKSELKINTTNSELKINTKYSELKRRLVRKINIWIPIYDDSCFNWAADADPFKMKQENCQELGGGKSIGYNCVQT